MSYRETHSYVPTRPKRTPPFSGGDLRSGMCEAEILPLAVSDAVADIAEEAMQAAFKVIADRMDALGYEVSGDVMPDEAWNLDFLFQGFVLGMALNNEKIAAMQS